MGVYSELFVLIEEEEQLMTHPPRRSLGLSLVPSWVARLCQTMTHLWVVPFSKPWSVEIAVRDPLAGLFRRLLRAFQRPLTSAISGLAQTLQVSWTR